MNNRVWETDIFYCTHLGVMDADEADIRSFTVKHSDDATGLLAYLQRKAFVDEVTGTMRTYMVRDQETDECAGYFSLKAGLVSTEEHKISDDETIFDTLPGVELAFFAVNEKYARGRKGIGAMMFEDLIEPIIRKTAEQVGVYLIYIFALPNQTLIRNYQDGYGFTRLTPEAEKDLHTRLRPRIDKNCIFMYKLVRQ